jgi:hypothetical protein
MSTEASENVKVIAREVVARVRPTIRRVIGVETPHQYDEADAMAESINEAVRQVLSREPFVFPPLGDTGAGDPPYPKSEQAAIWVGEGGQYAVAHQGDRPACAYRCHYPGGSSPCDLETAIVFVAHVAAGGTVGYSR